MHLLTYREVFKIIYCVIVLTTFSVAWVRIGLCANYKIKRFV